MSDQAKSQNIFVSVSQQRVFLLQGGAVSASWPCSTSGRGLGTESGSFKTPPGRLRIAEKIGGEEPLGTVFKARVPTGRVVLGPEGEEEADDLIVSRILWLDGLDPDNANTHSRYVYIHGTNHEREIGKPGSHGCVRMRNTDVAELYERVVVGTQVLIAS